MEHKINITLKYILSRTEVASTFSWKLNEKRLEDSWFLYEIVIYRSHGCLETTDLNTDVNQRDVEDLCEIANLIRSPKWVQHACKMRDCSEGMTVVVGNKKINRPNYAAPKAKVSVPDQDHCVF